jgi:histidine triad (HIT) family protein
MPSIFERIIAKEIPAEFLYEDDLCIVIKDRFPQAPVHFLMIPKKPIARLAESQQEADSPLLGHLLSIAQMVAKKQGLGSTGFRVVINNGPDAGETVPHLHVHVLGGRSLAWPPG